MKSIGQSVIEEIVKQGMFSVPHSNPWIIHWAANAPDQLEALIQSSFSPSVCAEKLFDMAQQDPDTASFLCIADTPAIENAEGCVIIVKGNQATRYIHALLSREKLLTKNKIPGFK